MSILDTYAPSRLIAPRVHPHDLLSMVATELEEVEPQTQLAAKFEQLQAQYNELREDNMLLMLERDEMGDKLLVVKAERNLARHEMHRGWADATDSRRALAVAQHNGAVMKKRILELEDSVKRLKIQNGKSNHTTE